MWKKAIVFSLIIFSTIVSAENLVGTGTTKVTRVGSYNQFGGGDVVFTLESPHADCQNGYWLTKSDDGFNANLSLILSAYQANNSVLVYGDTDQRWGGSPSGQHCKLYNIELR